MEDRIQSLIFGLMKLKDAELPTELEEIIKTWDLEVWSWIDEVFTS